MISQEDYAFIVSFDTNDSAARDAKLKENPGQAAKTFLNLLGHVSKDQTIQYILTMIDDMLQVLISLTDLRFFQYPGWSNFIRIFLASRDGRFFIFLEFILIKKKSLFYLLISMQMNMLQRVNQELGLK